MTIVRKIFTISLIFSPKTGIRVMSEIRLASDSFTFDLEEVRVLASVKYWALKSASKSSAHPVRQQLKNVFRNSSDVVDQQTYINLKLDWCEEWMKTTCELLELGELVKENDLPARLKALNLPKSKSAALSVEAATWEPFHELRKGETRYKKLRVDLDDFNNYCSYIQKLPGLKFKLADMRHDYQACTEKIVKIINGSNYTWVWMGAGALVLLLVAPYAAGMLGGMMGLGGAAATSAGLAFLGGGSLAAGGMGMAGGYVVLMAGGALLGYGGGSKQQREKFVETSKEELLVNCAKLHAMRHYLNIPKSEVCSNIHAMQIDLDSLADNLYCEGKQKDTEKQSSKAIVLATYRRIAREEVQF